MCDETINENERECPYCGYRYQPESEDYSEDMRVETCDECGKKFFSYDVFTVDHWARPDCELNGEKHDWQPHSLGDGQTHTFCEKCNKCQPHTPNAELSRR